MSPLNATRRHGSDWRECCFSANSSGRSALSSTAVAYATSNCFFTFARKEFFRNILRDQRAIITAPLHLKESDARFLLPLEPVMNFQMW
jgi:hypothetical protein